MGRTISENFSDREYWSVGWYLWADESRKRRAWSNRGARYYNEERAIEKLHQLQDDPGVCQVFAIHVEPYFSCDKRGRSEPVEVGEVAF